jgi:hypothetical protein
MATLKSEFINGSVGPLIVPVCVSMISVPKTGSGFTYPAVKVLKDGKPQSACHEQSLLLL